MSNILNLNNLVIKTNGTTDYEFVSDETTSLQKVVVESKDNSTINIDLSSILYEGVEFAVNSDLGETTLKWIRDGEPNLSTVSNRAITCDEALKSEYRTELETLIAKGYDIELPASVLTSLVLTPTEYTITDSEDYTVFTPSYEPADVEHNFIYSVDGNEVEQGGYIDYEEISFWNEDEELEVYPNGTEIDKDIVITITDTISGLSSSSTLKMLTTVYEGLCFTAEEDGSTVQFQKYNRIGRIVTGIQYSYDGKTWNNYTISDTVTNFSQKGEIITLENAGDKVYFRAENYNPTTSTDVTHKTGFNLTGSVSASGSVMSMTGDVTSTDMTDKNFKYMFYGCTALTTAPELPATTLSQQCYMGMFSGCTSLTSAPVLNATTATASCYYAMFQDCTSLTSAPVLPATTLATYCYQNMFNGCSNLNYIEVGATSWSTSNTSSWVEGVATTGTFIKPENTEIPTGINGIPTRWVVNPQYEGLCFTAETAGSTVKQNRGKSGSTYYTSTDGLNWTSYSLGSTIRLNNVGDKVYWKGDGISNSTTNAVFSLTGNVGASGSVMSLIDGEGTSTTIPSGNNFRYLFGSCSSLKSAPVLNATVLTDNCYQRMFHNCTSLTNAPELPATDLTSYCYSYMFYGCSALTDAQVLNATVLKSHCYEGMFNGCSSLTTAPTISATELDIYSCQYMFAHCTSLTSAPVLNATTLSDYCYQYMFEDCASLTSAPVLNATTATASCYYAMFQDCTSLTTAPELPATTTDSGSYGRMFKGCSSLTTAPYIASDSVDYLSYYEMFDGCSSLNYIKVGATSWDTYNAQDWVYGVANTGTFVIDNDVLEPVETVTTETQIPINSNSGIPTNWTIVGGKQPITEQWFDVDRIKVSKDTNTYELLLTGYNGEDITYDFEIGACDYNSAYEMFPLSFKDSDDLYKGLTIENSHKRIMVGYAFTDDWLGSYKSAYYNENGFSIGDTFNITIYGYNSENAGYVKINNENAVSASSYKFPFVEGDVYLHLGNSPDLATTDFVYVSNIKVGTNTIKIQQNTVTGEYRLTL